MTNPSIFQAVPFAPGWGPRLGQEAIGQEERDSILAQIDAQRAKNAELVRFLESSPSAKPFEADTVAYDSLLDDASSHADAVRAIEEKLRLSQKPYPALDFVEQGALDTWSSDIDSMYAIYQRHKGGMEATTILAAGVIAAVGILVLFSV